MLLRLQIKKKVVIRLELFFFAMQLFSLFIIIIGEV